MTKYLSPLTTNPDDTLCAALVEQGHRYMPLPATGVKPRPEFDGMVHNQTGPVVEWNEELYQVFESE